MKDEGTSCVADSFLISLAAANTNPITVDFVVRQKSNVILCTNALSVLQWKYQFLQWTSPPNQCLYERYKGHDPHGRMCIDYHVHHDLVRRQAF